MTGWRPSRFGLALASIALGALALRLVYALRVMGDHRFIGDATEFHLLARTLADTGSYLQPFPWLLGHARIATAEKPPLYPLYLAAWTKLGLSSYHWHLVASCLLGTGTVATIGAVGRRVAGPRLGLTAAALAAVYPGLVVLDGSLRSESLYVLLVLSLLAAYGLAERPTRGRAAMLGVVIALAALTRAEALLLIVLLGLPAIWLGRARGGRLRLALALCTGCAVLVVPWLARNWAEFDRPAGISTNEGGLLAGANCPRAYYGDAIGTWACFPKLVVPLAACTRRYYPLVGRSACISLPRAARDRNEAIVSGRLRARALRYAGHHAGRVPAVAGVRLLRTWDLWEPSRSAAFESVLNDRNEELDRWAQRSLYVLALLALAGAIVLRRRERALRLLLALPVLVSVVAMATYGSSRFRAAAEVSVVILAAAALEAGARRIQGLLAPGRLGTRD